MLGLLIWGAVHVVGAYRQATAMHHNPMRALVLGLFVLGFIAFWGCALKLAARKRRQRDLPASAEE